MSPESGTTPELIGEYDFFGGYSHHTFDNQMDLLVKPLPDSETVTTQLWFEAGSLWEDDDNNGLSHFLEHMLFKGTDNFSRQTINQYIDEVGGSQNAATSNDYTHYYATLPSEHWDRGPRLLRDMGFNAKLPQDEFEKERHVVISELDRYQDRPRKKLWKQFIPNLYKEHPYERLTIGTREVLESATIDQLRTYYETYYSPNRSTLVIAGDVTVDEAVGSIADLFSAESAVPEPDNGFPELEPPSSDEINRITGDVGQVYGIMGTVGYRATDTRSIALDVLMQMLGGGRASRLHENLVVKQSLASSISSSFWTQREPGPAMIRFQTNPDRLDELISAIDRQRHELAQQGFSTEEFERAKTAIKSDFIYNSQTPSGQARQLGYWHTVDTINYLNDYLQKIKTLDPDTVQKVADDVLDRRAWTGVVLTPEGSTR